MLKFKQYIEEGVNDPDIFKAIFLAGGIGSGKSFITSKTTTGFGLKLISSDEIFEFLMKKSGVSLKLMFLSPKEYANAMEHREKAKELTQKRQLLFLKGRLGMVIDGTARNFARIKKQKEILNNIGYDTFMVFVNTSLDVALERNARRARSIKEDIARKAWKDVQENIGKFQNLFGGENFIIVDNNKFDENILNKAAKEVRKVIKKPIRNPLAKQWIKAELDRIRRD